MRSRSKASPCYRGQCRWFAARGYVVVNQDCRGCFGSEGEVNFLVPEAEDGADTIAWIRRQEWCDGTVGAFGTSWSGWTLELVVKADNPLNQLLLSHG